MIEYQEEKNTIIDNTEIVASAETPTIEVIKLVDQKIT